MDAVKVLLRAKAYPLLSTMDTGPDFVPLDVAAKEGHLEVVRWMIEEVGIEGCGGASGGVVALCQAAMGEHVDIMAVLTNAGVGDTGKSLVHATACGREAAVKFLLQQKDWKTGGAVAYVNSNTNDNFGRTPLSCAITGFDVAFPPSPRVVRLLVDAGADTALIFPQFDDTPLAATTRILNLKRVGGTGATQEQLHKLEGIRRLLLRVEAVHAVSWLWPDSTAFVDRAVEGKYKTKKVSIPVTLTLPILRRRAARPRVLLAALFRCGVKARFFFSHIRCMCLAAP